MTKGKDNKPGAATHTITDILKITQGTLDVWLVGGEPIILNRMSEKAKHELLVPHGRLTEVEKQTRLKHDPIAEYRASPYTLKDARQPTLLAHLAAAFKKAMMTAALDLPGTKKAQIGRLVWVQGQYVGLYGLPKLFMAPVRSADMNRTPDIRTRAIVPEWAAHLEVTFTQPLIRAQAVANLLGAAGLIAGVGDWRPEKGAGNFGQFRIVDQDDKTLRRIMATGGRAAQEAALAKPVAYDDETTEMLSWYDAELANRKQKGADTHVIAASDGSTDRVHSTVGKRARTNHSAPSGRGGAVALESLT
jgi:hypothetical protein